MQEVKVLKVLLGNSAASPEPKEKYMAIDPMVQVANVVVALLLRVTAFSPKELEGVALSSFYDLIERSYGEAKDGIEGLDWRNDRGSICFDAENKNGKVAIRIHPGTHAFEVKLYAHLENKPPDIFGQMLDASWALDYGYVMHANVYDLKFTRSAANYQRDLLRQVVEQSPVMKNALNGPFDEEKALVGFLYPPQKARRAA